MESISVGIKNEIKAYKSLLRNVPSLVVSLFILSVVCMNLLANKELFSTPYLALDCGFTLSWISFLCMDMICKRFGAKAAMRVSILAIGVNLITCLIFNLLSRTSGSWGEYYSLLDQGQEYLAINADVALNHTFGGSWYVVFGSAFAMFISSGVNSVSNHLIAKATKTTGFTNFALRSWVSTGLAQFVDNLVFATVVSHVFFGWTWIQVITCSLTGAIMELLCEIIFSPIGYKVSKTWTEENVGKDYIDQYC